MIFSFLLDLKLDGVWYRYCEFYIEIVVSVEFFCDV